MAAGLVACHRHFSVGGMAKPNQRMLKFQEVGPPLGIPKACGT